MESQRDDASSRLPPTSLTTFLHQTLTTVNELGFDPEGKYPHDGAFTKRVLLEGAPSLLEAIAVIAMTFLYILLRYSMDPIVTRLARWARLNPRDVTKSPSCVFHAVYYCMVTAYGAHVSNFSGRYNFIQQPCEVYNLEARDEEYFTLPIPWDIKALYFIQFSYYMSAFYMTLFVDYTKRDYKMMICHHCITLLLIYFSYSVRFLKHGCIIFYLFDISDACLETGKLIVYVNNRGGKTRRWGVMFTNCLFGLFILSWFYFRIYLYPMRLLHASNWCVYLAKGKIKPRFYVFFNVLLWLLYGMQLTWTYYILAMCFRLLTGRDKGIVDIRENLGEPGKTNSGTSHPNVHMANGTTKTN